MVNELCKDSSTRPVSIHWFFVCSNFVPTADLIQRGTERVKQAFCTKIVMAAVVAVLFARAWEIVSFPTSISYFLLLLFFLISYFFFLILISKICLDYTVK